MDFSNVGNLIVKNNYDKNALDTICAKAHAGNTIIFMGAGFSVGALSYLKSGLPLASQLSKEICNLGNFDEDDDLAFSADYFLKYNSPTDLIDFLKSKFLVSSSAEHHQSIASVDWRRIYTTNYDDVYETASKEAGKPITPLTLIDNPTHHFRKRDVCIHINGSILKLESPEDFKSSFKLADSSYTNSDAFSDSSWQYRFRKDLELCSQIIFIGYSLYDMEVKRLLVHGDDIRNKVSFITHTGISTKDHHRLSAFGEVFPIGVEEFGKKLKSFAPENPCKSFNYLSSLRKIELSYDEIYSDINIRDFLLRGICDDNHLAASLTTEKQKYAIDRTQSKEVISLLANSDAVVLHGSLANGKSVIAKQVAADLTIEGKRVYDIRDSEGDYEADIESLAEQNETIYLIIDDFEKNLDIVIYFSHIFNSRGKLLLTERPHRYRRAVNELEKHKIQVNSINVDYLHREEAESLNAILDSTGLWGNLAGSSAQHRMKFIQDKCESQISILLLTLLKSPHVRDRFRSAFSSILDYPDTKKTIHAVCIIQHVYPSACTRSFISDLSDSNHIYSKEFEDRINSSGIFEFRGNEIKTTSSVFGTYLLNSLYKSSYSIDQLVRILKKLHSYGTEQSIEGRELYRSIMTFGTLSAVLPDENKPNSYIEFYEKAKKEVPSVQGNPNYWLHYAMSVMSGDNLSDAEIILNTAYAKAKNNEGYDTSYIDNQYARLNLKKAIVESDPKLNFEYFMSADRILKREHDAIYKFRQAGLYIPYYENRYSALSRKNKVEFEHSLKYIIKQYQDFLAYEYRDYSAPPYLIDNLRKFEGVLSEITQQRA